MRWIPIVRSIQRVIPPQAERIISSSSAQVTASLLLMALLPEPPGSALLARSAPESASAVESAQGRLIGKPTWCQ
jgi:hypothetical protein